ncbi:YesN/AraC family two-component response regulator [Pedobacter africanus]|uniref:YesN/AraC family two-component response regulator n=1 Tax=Pedobacter africanus TaxID=151894 RepID=A0ACC6KRQ0_9SPHI|nr:response regulator [Pedobacter africanus]MDR6781939.1 YesN/AraC family two-component response regulator [Pedobacter africanus]
MALDKNAYQILVIEDNTGDFVLVEDFLFEQIEAPKIVQALNYKDAVNILSNQQTRFDIILLDLSLPDNKGEKLIQGVVALSQNTPVIVLTGYEDFAFGVKSLSLGVSDYILKDELTALSLYKSIIYNSERKKINNALEAQNKKLQDIAWMHSHSIRSPLSKVMGLAELLKLSDIKDKEIAMLIEHLLSSANELDEAIQNISNKSTS